MPFIEEQDLIYLHKQIESEVEERNKIEKKFRDKSFQLEDTKRKTKMFQILAVALGLALLGSIGYFLKKSTEKVTVDLTPQELEVKVNKYLEEQNMASISKDSLDNLTEIAFKYEMMDMQSDDSSNDSDAEVASTDTDTTASTADVAATISEKSVTNYLANQGLVAISRDKLESLKTKATAYTSMNNDQSTAASTTSYSGKNPFKGYVYSVGIGSLKKNGIKLNSGEFSNFNRFQGNLDTYSIGNFKTYKEATDFKLKVRKYLKIRDAYLVAYKDGKHVSVKTALKENGK